ncbi:CPSF A subunit region-domain-containing protein [Protomyces lactucae-debilis]|uniref:CPSF A subunit region-domain-containing protein n=1 Tax=Protomyces lactucae-debilis TaxID=2754530 RepID=A0A1Y2F9M6_PROLT|nr:CPSF A subunit region-domain-containing protein [Protomyces lactucae-debilis]ORY80337.1 CPSF A subunit region-domain-containing protein [Protomyces lactucae-debilis]
MSIYSSETDPTVVTDAVYLHFTERGSKQLVVAKRSLLQVYTFIQKQEDLCQPLPEDDMNDAVGQPADADADFGANLKITATQKQTVTKLVLIAELKLAGTITGLGVVRPKDFASTGIELLLVSFEVAKLSLLAWSSAEHTMTTISIHAFERDEFMSSLHSKSPGVLRLDPASRVATLSFYDQRFAFLPIAQVDELLAEDEETKEGVIVNSFVLSMSQLEDDIAQMIDFNYLDGYREPTMAILFMSETTAPALKDWRKDTIQLVVLTLDIQAGARTAIFEIDKLPADLHTIYPVPEPVGGCLLIGNNELIYVDPAARTVALAVNSYAKLASDYDMRDYAQLELKLEGARAVALKHDSQLDGIFLCLADARLALLTLNMDGRTVSSLHLKVVSADFGADALQAVASCAILVDGRRLFLGSELGDSSLVAWQKRARKAEVSDAVQDVAEADDDLDDLYGDDAATKQILGSETTTFDIRFSLHDSLHNSGPIISMTPRPLVNGEKQETRAPAELALIAGHGRSGNLTFLRKSIEPNVVGKFDSPAWQAMWTLRTRSPQLDSTDVQNALDTYLVASKKTETQIFTIDAAFVEKTDSEFETSDGTIAAGTVDGNTCVVQICADMMRTYDADLKLLQLIPTPETCTVVSASIVDPFVLLLLSTGKVAIYTTDAQRDLIEVHHKLGGNLASAVLFRPAKSSVLDSWLTPSKKRKRAEDSGKPSLCFSVSKDGTLAVHQVPSMSLVFQQTHVDFLPRILDGEEQSVGFKPACEPIVEILVADLGQNVLAPHLVLRNKLGDLTIYNIALNESKVVFFKVDNLALTHHGEAKGQTLMTSCTVGEYACVFVKGKHPHWIIQSDQSLPTLFPASTGPVRSFSGFNTLDAPEGYIYCDALDVIRICTLPDGFRYDQRWSSRHVKLGCNVDGLAYFPEQQYYALATSRPAPYEIRDEDNESLPPPQDNAALLPTFDRGSLEVMDNTYKLIDRYDFAANEQVLCLKYAAIKVHTDVGSSDRPCMAVATGIFRGEDLAMRGAIYLFEVIDAEVEADSDESVPRLRMVVREEIKAAATTLCELDGYLVAAQGHKVLVRSLEEDERLAPVGFIDLGLYSTTAKALRNTVLFGDIQQGLRFVGFQEEPYRLVLFGRDYEGLDVVDADFMVHGKALYFVASDPNGNLVVMQYDPDNSASIAGTHLVRKGDIHAGKQITCMSTVALLPSQDDIKADSDRQVDSTVVLCGGRDGSLSTMTPVSERVFRRLYTVQTHLSGSLLLPACLNEREYRHSHVADKQTSNALRGILDCDFIKQFAGLDAIAKAEVAKKCAVSADGVLDDLQDLQRATSWF